MAIAKMNKFTLLTFHSHRDVLLKQLQVFGDVHFRNLGQQDLLEMDFLRPDFLPEQLSSYEQELEKVRFATAKIAPYVEKPKISVRRKIFTFAEFDRYADEYDYGAVYDKVKEQDDAIAAFRSEIARLTAENDSLRAWSKLDVSPKDLDSLSATGYLIGTVNKQIAAEFVSKVQTAFEDAYVELLDTVKDDAALLLLFPSEKAEDIYAFAREQGFTKAAFQFKGIPNEIIDENDHTMGELTRNLEKAAMEIGALAPEHPKLQIALDYFNAVLEREKACQNFLQSDTVVLIEGWVPAEESGRLKEILGAVCGKEYFLEEGAVEHDSETVPIKLKNNRFVKAFESITDMYSLPKYNELDPTPVLAPFYWLFFGMMVGDIGYGCVLLLGTTLALKFLDLKPGMNGFMRLFRWLSVSVIIMGAVYGGAFGVTVFTPISYVSETGEVMKKAILDSQLDITTMLIISVIIGVVHILVGLVTKTYVCFRDGQYFDGFCDGILWAVTLLSGIGLLIFGFVMVQYGTVGTICKWVLVACLVGLVATQGRSSPSISGKIGNGLFGAYGLSSYVGDVVSYTRLVALALSGAYIAYAFNLMSELVAGEFGAGNVLVSGIRLIFAIAIAIFGQSLNMGLALLGGYVHSCRLQYVEFFGKFYEGGGVVFRPLSLKNEYTQIKN